MDKFTFERLSIPDLVLVRPRKFSDDRGFFMETWTAPVFRDAGISAAFVQDNHSLSRKRGTIRGLHFQRQPFAQAKLVRIVRGSVYDVGVDLRRSSPTYGKWAAVTLTAEAGEQLFIPAGFAHGFCTLEPDTEMVYKVDALYSAECDGGLAWNDPDLAIDWPVRPDEVSLSAKDQKLPPFAGFASPF